MFSTRKRLGDGPSLYSTVIIQLLRCIIARPLRFFYLFAIYGGLLSCQPLSPPSEPLRRWEALLINHSWQLCCQTINPAICFRNSLRPQTDLQTIRPACDRDDFLSFSDPGRWKLEDGPLTCTPGQLNPKTHGDWVLSGSSDSLMLQMINREGSLNTYQLLHLDSTTMVRRYQYLHDRTNYTITETLQKIH